MRRKTWIPLLASAMTLGMSLTAFAGTWKSNGTGWWYENADGSYLTGWNWVDGNGDGIAESYYFQNDGYLLTNTTVEGYQVNGDGAWVVNGAVQTKGVGASAGNAAAQNDTVFSRSGSKKGLATRDTLFDATSVRDLGVKHIIYNFTNYEQNFMDNFRNTKANGVSVTAIMLNTLRNNPSLFLMELADRKPITMAIMWPHRPESMQPPGLPIVLLPYIRIPWITGLSGMR